MSLDQSFVEMRCPGGGGSSGGSTDESGAVGRKRSPRRPPPVDPFLELELYLERVNEEIGKVINQYLENGDEDTRSDGVESNNVTVGTQTSPTRSHTSSPGFLSDCERSSLRSFQSACGSTESSSSSSLETVARQDVTPSSDSDIWVPMKVVENDDSFDIPCINRHGVYFDEVNGFGGILDEQPPTSTSARSLPLAGGVPPPVTLRTRDRSHSDVLLARELGNKSSSAPVLKKAHQSTDRLSSHGSKVTKQSRSQSDRHLAEIQAAEACKWLRAAGFPQYAQMYEDHQFPIDLSSVQKDHQFLDPDSCTSLFRRLETLNKCANIRVDSWRTNQDDSEDENNQCALSDNWTFQHDQKRWSRTRNDPLQPLAPGNPSDCNSNQLSSGLSVEDMTLARTGSERLKDGARALLRRVESIKSRRRKKQNRENVVIKDGGIIGLNNLLDVPIRIEISKNTDTYQSTENVYPTSPKSPTVHPSPLPSPRRLCIRSPNLFYGNASSRKAFVNRRGSVSLDRRDTVEVMSDSEVNHKSSRKLRSTEKLRYDGNLSVSDYDSDLDELNDITESYRTSWHSFQRGSLHSRYSKPEGCPISSLTCGQLQVLRKFALLKLTAVIEKHCPTHRSGWNWELPKFIRKIKTPDYKSKIVFGVPLTVILQRSGYPLPVGIQKALKWLRMNALDQVGLFRKSGVKSRIHALKTSVESTNDFTTYDDQQSYDVADMVKQYFRELPEALLTTKLSETLILIFQHLPKDLRREAVSCVLLLMPNENCEVLQTILNFLRSVSEQSQVNQMTASNIALCFAPSLFYYNQAATLSTSVRINSVSPRRKKGTGVPDMKELSENKAAHECLLYLIQNQNSLFTVPKEFLTKCKFTVLDESKPVTLSELGEQTGWKGYMEACIHALQKEAKDRTRGWVSLGNAHNLDVELAYKKVGDGHPLRLWRAATEVEAPPQEVLHRVLRERKIWDRTLIKIQPVQQLEQNCEVYQYVCSSMEPLLSRDYCVLRMWRTDLPRGACVIVETSVEHKGAEAVQNSVRAVVLASRYLIEPCGSGKSRLMHLSRIDLMGRTPEWYNKSYGYVCRLHLSEIRNSFKHSCPVGPESKV